jgi:hypothetical protein
MRLRNRLISATIATLLLGAGVSRLLSHEYVTEYKGTVVWEETFEDNTTSRIFPEINVDPGVDPFYCDEPYTGKCTIPADYNPWQEFMRRPEFKPSDVPNRVVSGKSGQFFGFYGVIKAGYQKQVATVAGKQYQLSFYGQIWDADDAYGGCLERRASDNKCSKFNGTPYTSDTGTESDRTAAFMYAAIDPTCGTNAFASTVQNGPSVGYYYDDNQAGDSSENGKGLYDQYELVTLEFTAQGGCTTLFVGGWNKYAKAHNDFYVDNFRLSVIEELATNTPSPSPTATLQATAGSCVPQIVTATPDANAQCYWFTPTPIGTQSTPSVTAQPQPTGQGCAGCVKEERWYTVNTTPPSKLNVRRGTTVSSPIDHQVSAGTAVFIQCVVTLSTGVKWGSEQPCGANVTWMMMQWLKQ